MKSSGLSLLATPENHCSSASAVRTWSHQDLVEMDDLNESEIVWMINESMNFHDSYWYFMVYHIFIYLFIIVNKCCFLSRTATCWWMIRWWTTQVYWRSWSWWLQWQLNHLRNHGIRNENIQKTHFQTACLMLLVDIWRDSCRQKKRRVFLGWSSTTALEMSLSENWLALNWS